MIRPSSIAWVILAVALCTGLFLVKQQVQALETRLAQLNETILEDQQAIHVLRAEWSYLNQPARLGELGRRLLHLEPRTGVGITSIDSLTEERTARPPRLISPKPELDPHASPLVSPGFATPISAAANLETPRSDDGGWVRAILIGQDRKQ